MNKLNFLLSFVCISLLVSCKSTASLSDIKNLKKVVANKSFEFNASNAIPLSLGNIRGIENLMPNGSSSGNINLNGNPNFMIVKNDSIHMDMPYYGRRNLGGGYNPSDVGLKFKSNIKTETSSYNSKKNSYIIKYNINNNQENLILTLTLYANKSSNLNVISSHRNTINYQGNWKAK